MEDEEFFPLATTNPLRQINYFTSGTELSHCEQHIAGINAHQLAKLCAFSKLGWLAFEGTVTHADLCVATQCKKLGGFHSQAALTVSDFLRYRMEGFFFFPQQSAFMKRNVILLRNGERYGSHIYIDFLPYFKTGEKWGRFTFLIGLRKHSHSFPYRKLFQKSKPLKPHRMATSNPSNLAIFFATLKKRRRDKKGASHCGNTKWSPAELRQSGNPWQCDFCLLLCIKSRCQEPSPPQPWLNPPCTSLPLLLWPWRRRMITSTAAAEQMWPERKGEVWVRHKNPYHTMTCWVIMYLKPLAHLPGMRVDATNVCSNNNFK